jgi:hypothetical protein
MSAEATRRVLVAIHPRRRARSIAQPLVANGQVVFVDSIAQAWPLHGVFDHAVLSFDLSDGSGIVFAAILLAEDRLKTFAFIHPETEAPAVRLHKARSSALLGSMDFTSFIMALHEALGVYIPEREYSRYVMVHGRYAGLNRMTTAQTGGLR